MFVISFLIHVLFIELVFAGIQRLPSISLNEQSPIGTSIYELVRVYTTSTRPLTYSFLSDSSPHNSFFMIDSLTGRISIKRMIDREELCQTQICNCEKCILTLEIIASSKNIDILSIDITIENINDNQPNFPISTFDIRLSENTDVGHIASFPSATDLDYQSRLDYRLVPLNDVDDADLVETFAIAHLQTENQLGLRLLKTLDRERRQLYQMKILATDGELNGQLTLNVNVLDSNDNVPKFEHDQYHIKLRENLPVGNEILTVRALDNDEGLNAQINYTILNDSPTSLFPFEINSTTGVIRLVQALDYETETNYRFNVRARDNGPDAINVYGEVQIDIVDVNDCPPEIDFILPDADPSRIDSKQHRFFIEEEQPINTKLFHLSVSDKDSINDKITLKLLNHQDLFQLNEQYNDLYSLSIVGRLDREKQEEYFLHFQAKDRGSFIIIFFSFVRRKLFRLRSFVFLQGAGTSLTSEKFLTIVLLDINDCAPIVDVHENPLKIDENKIIVGEILRIRANDFDAENSSNSLLEYSLLKTNDSDLFEINSTNGILKVRQKRSFDFETRSTYSLIVNVSDHGSKPKRLETLHEITISINDLNDNAPKFVEEFYEFHIKENLPIGTFIGRVKAIDFDSNSTIEYELEPNGEENFFSVDPKTGDLITKNRLDFETRSIHQLNVVANDNDHRHTSKVHVQINLIDLNDNAPIVESPTSIYVPSEFLSTNATTTIKIAQILAKDHDQNQNGTLTFSIADGNSDFFFQIDPSNGTISATTKYLAQGRHRLTVRVCDQPTIDQKCSNVVLNIQIGESIEKVFDESKPRKTEQILTREMVIVVLISTILTLVFSITMGILIACICKQKACRHLHRSTLKKPCQLIQSTDADKLLTSNSLLSTNKVGYVMRNLSLFLSNFGQRSEIRSLCESRLH